MVIFYLKLLKWATIAWSWLSPFRKILSELMSLPSERSRPRPRKYLKFWKIPAFKGRTNLIENGTFVSALPPVHRSIFADSPIFSKIFIFCNFYNFQNVNFGNMSLAFWIKTTFFSFLMFWFRLRIHKVACFISRLARKAFQTYTYK